MRRAHILTILLAVTSLALTSTPTPTAVTTPTPGAQDAAPVETVWSPSQKLTEAQKKFVTEDPKAIQERQDLLSYKETYLKEATSKSQQETFGKSEAEGLKLELITDVDNPDVGKQVLVSPDMKDFVFIPMNDNWKNPEEVNNTVDGVELVEAENYSKIIRKSTKKMVSVGVPSDSDLRADGDRFVFVKNNKIVDEYVPQYDKIWPIFKQNAEGEVSFDMDGKVLGKLQKAYYMSSEESKTAEYDIVKIVDGKEVRYPIPPAKDGEKVLMLQFTTNTINMMPFVNGHNIVMYLLDNSSKTKIEFSNFESYPSNDKDISGFIEYALPVPADLNIKGVAIRTVDGYAMRIYDVSQSKPEVTR
jgi:hypothetical protein